MKRERKSIDALVLDRYVLATSCKFTRQARPSSRH